MVSLFLLVKTAKIFTKSREALARGESVSIDIVELEGRKSLLESELSRLETESGKEEAVRKEFDIAKPGEKVLVIVKNPNDDFTIEEKGFFRRTWENIKKRF